MAAPSSTYNYHNRFAETSNPSEQSHGNQSQYQGSTAHDDIFNFSEFKGLSESGSTGLISNLVHDDRASQSSHISSSAESYTRRNVASNPTSHVDALEAAVESHEFDDADEESEGREEAVEESVGAHSSSAGPYSRNSPPTSSHNVSKFQQAINGSYEPRAGPPRLPLKDTTHQQINGDFNQQTSETHSFSGDHFGLERGIEDLGLNGRGSRTPEPGVYGNIPRERHDDDEEDVARSRPSSFFGLEKGVASIDPNAGVRIFPMYNNNGVAGDDVPAMAGAGDEPESTERRRPSSFFGMEQPMGHVPNPERLMDGQSQAARIAASHRNAGLVTSNEDNSGPMSPSGSNGAPDSNSASTTRPASLAPTLSGPILDHSHLKPGLQAALLSHNKTLELYRQNAKKTNDPNLIYEFAVFMVDASKSMGGDDSSGGTGPGTDYTQGKEENAREELIREAIGLLKKIAERGHMDAQYFLADCYANGIGSPKGKQDFDRAYPLFVLAAKHGHPDAAYRAGTCFEKGWGCRKDASKSLQFYRKASSQSHPGAMYRLATAELNGDLGLKKSAREGVKWLKRSAESATPEFPHALHELALLHERGVDNVLFVDPEYACELLAQAAEMGYAPSAYKLGFNYEYGRMGCPQDGGLSIHMYNIAAQQNHKEACFALTAWYLVGAPGILPQSDTEAYLWAKKAAEQGLAKAEYAVGYFTEVSKDRREMREEQKNCAGTC
jgi:TPR repeat protein